MTVQQGHHALRNRHVHAKMRGALHHGTCTVNPFSHMTQRPRRLRQRLPLGQCQAHLAIARQVPGSGQYQVAQATQSHKGLCARAQGNTQACHFGQATGDQRGTGIQAQRKAVTQTGRDGQNVFNGTTDFHACNVIIGIDPQRGAVKCSHQRLAYPLVGAGGHQRRRLAARHLQCKTWPTEHARY